MKNLQSIKSPDAEFLEKLKTLRMPIYRCSCGCEILIIPDLAAMSLAIQRHIGHHNRITGDHLTEDMLIIEIIRVVSKMSPPIGENT